MKFKTRHVRLYLPATLLGFLIVKLMLGGTLLYMKRPMLNSRPALAEDIESRTGQNRSSTSPSDGNAPLLTEPSLNLQNLGASVEILECKRAEIETERRQLERERKQLTALKQEIEANLVQLSEIQESIQRKLDEQKIIRDNKIKHLIKIYTTMAPKKAAALIEKLDMDVIIELFSEMKGEHVGQILPHVSAEKAAKISEHLARRD
jgi:flagellar motility protein MotE (MotC chaperone)